MKVAEVVNILNKNIKRKGLKHFYEYMANMLIEEPPITIEDCFELIGDFLTDGMVYSTEEANELCGLLVRVFLEKGLRDELKDTILPTILSNPICIGEISDDIEYDLKEGRSDTIDPMLDYDKYTSSIGTNLNLATEEEITAKEKEAKKKQLDAIDKQMKRQKKAPPLIVKHSGGDYKMDVLVNNVTIIIGGKSLLENAKLKLNYGRKYGLIGRNGIGKTTLLNQIARKEIEGFPEHLHVLHVEQEIDPEDKSVIDHVLECDTERTLLLQEEKDLLEIDKTKLKKHKVEKMRDKLYEVQKRLSEIGAHEAEYKASKILNGLGFQQEDMNRKSQEFSGGWRMRITLAKALFSNPDILLLDEPTNHLDLDAVLWLEQYVQDLDITVVIVSHAREFLNNVAEEIIHFFDAQLEYYKGNYDQYEKTRTELIKQRKKQVETQNKQADHLQKFIDKFRYNAKRASLVQSRIKALKRMDIMDEITEDPSCVFIFPEPEMIQAPILRLTESTIGYGAGKVIADDVNIDVNLESRIAIVGPNGAGKTTLLKTLVGELEPMDGTHFVHQRLRIGLFNQHHVESLDLRLSALEQMMDTFGSYNTQDYRSHLGSFGLSGNLSIRPMYLLSGGQKSRVSFAIITYKKPHVIIMDEPTNHLDIDAINALMIACESYKGGLVIVSHDQYFMEMLSEIYIVNDGEVKKFDGTFLEYKEYVIKNKH